MPKFYHHYQQGKLNAEAPHHPTSPTIVMKCRNHISHQHHRQRCCITITNASTKPPHHWQFVIEMCVFYLFQLCM
jgi:hypothetical protein